MTARPQWISPSLAALPDGTVPAYELKFVVPGVAAAAIQQWAGERMTADPHAGPTGAYQITSVYYDTPVFDVLRQVPGFDVHKYRVRRYGGEPTVHLERKSKKDGRVWKCRAAIPLTGLAHPVSDWPAPWFVQELIDRDLRPVCRVTYERTAFVGAGLTGPIRLTLDRTAVGVPAVDPAPEPVTAGIPLLTDEVVVEFKYLATLPAAFKEVIEAHQLSPTGLSKYRRCARTLGVAACGPV